MKKRFIYLLFLVGFSSLLSAQQKKIDSLENLLKTDKEDTNKVNHLNSLAKIYIGFHQWQKDSVYSHAAIVLSQKIGYKKGNGLAYADMGIERFIENDYRNTIKYDSTAIDIFKNAGDTVRWAIMLIHASSAYLSMGEYALAIETASKGTAIAKKIGDKREEAFGHGQLGTIYSEQDNYPQALDMQLKALALLKQMNNKTLLAQCMLNISIVYQNLRDTANTLKYNFAALQIAKEVKDYGLEANNLSNIALVYKYQKKYAKAIDFNRQGLFIHEKINDKQGIATNMYNMGAIYFDMGQYDSSLTYNLKGGELSRTMGDIHGIAISIGNVAEVYFKQEKYALAERYLLEADSIAIKNGMLGDLKEVESNLAELYSKTKQWQKAYQYQLRYTDTKDSIYSTDKSREIGHLEAQYQYAKDSAIQQAKFINELAIQQAQTEKKAAESKTEKVIIGLIASVAAILILLIALGFQRMKDVQKKKLVLEQQKAWLELKALRTQMNPHFLYNTLNSIQSFVLQNDTKASADYLSQFAGLMRSVLENSRKDKITLAEEIEGLRNYIEFEIMRFPQKFNYNIKVDSSLDREKAQLPPLLIQPYVENAIWHGLMHLEERTGELNINFEKKGYQIKCTVDDNGIGRAASGGLKKQFTHKSVGLSIIEERMQSMNKMYHWDMKAEVVDKTNEKGMPLGTRAELFLPLILNTVAYA